MTALEPPPPADPELQNRMLAQTVRCGRCAAAANVKCDLQRYPYESKKGPFTYHPVRLQRARQGW